MIELKNITIKKAQEGLKNKDFSSKELTKAFLEKIEKEDKNVNAFLDVFKEEALERAKKADERIAKGEIDALTGIPCSIKDNMLIKGKRCTAGSKMLEKYIASYNAHCIEKLNKQGAVILGKTNLDEFAMGSSCENSAFFPTKNPHDKTRVPGGSSGGSAASVASDMCVYSLGSDTGGSIRQPASFCGVVGLKPTYGTVSRSGLIAFASSLDQIGPFTKTVEDAKIVFEAIRGKDDKDSTSIDLEYREHKLDVKKLRIGVPKEYFSEGLDKEIRERIEEAIDCYKEMGAEIVEISLPSTEYALACYYIIAPAEASANLARFDGIRYGHSSDKAKDLLETYVKSRKEGFGDEVKRRIMIGTYTLSSGYYDAYYKKALKVRTLIKKDFEKAFDEVDVILGPTSPILPFKIGEKVDDPMAMYLSDIYTVSVNLAGLPGISIPVGKSKKGLPIGLQIIGAHFQENKLFEIAKLIEEKYGF